MKNNKYIYILTAITVIIYLLWRLIFTIPWHSTLFATTFGFLLWVSECVSAFTATVLIWTKAKYKDVVMPNVEADALPHVDVFIATHNEDVDILYKTVNGCVNMIYPDKSKVHIYISDDTNRESVKALADQFGVGYIGLEGNKHAKSGNLNNAMKHSNSPLIATFDADMIPYSNFLMETIPYYINDDQSFNESIGFIQTPQSFYNADIFHYNLFAESRVPNEQDFFSREVNILNSAHNATVYTGSNTVISRQAIIDAGYFPTNTITEDFQLGATINSLGYQSIATLDALGSGLTPTEIKSVLKQRTRWARGVIQSIYNLNVFFNKQMTWGQKLVYTTNFLYWWSFARRLLYILAPILFTVFDIRVVETDFWILLVFWVPSYIMQSIAMSQVSSTIRTQRWGEIYETILAPYLVIPVFLETFGIKQNKFKVTNKNQKNSRMEILFVLPHLILLILSIIGIIRFNYGKYGSELFYGSVINFWLVHHIINLFFAVFFSLGRPVLRQHERFNASEILRVKTAHGAFDTHTHNISERGMSFSLDVPVYVGDDDLLEFEIEGKGYKASLQGYRVRVISQEDKWTYMIRLTEIDDEDRRQYMQIIYDRYNDFLPKQRDMWMTSFDEFWNVITSRYARLLKKEPTVYTKPLIKVNRKYTLNDTPVVLDIFDYDKLTMTYTGKIREFPNLKITVDDVVMRFVFDDIDRSAGILTYQLSNKRDVIDAPDIEAKLLKWRKTV